MSGNKLTDERLRTWIQDQASRERLCLAILSLEQGYRNPTPRRPSGGPDGGRDIEAFRDRELIWGAVGFRNSVNDSTADRTWASKKFKKDLSSARKASPNLRGFAFFTNVDLTPGQVRALEKHARRDGFNFVDIFIRERIRIHLDSPRGMSLRYQFLDLPLSDAEQKTFFSEWGSELESLLHRRLSVLEQQAERLEFMNSCHWPLKSIRLEIVLDREYPIDELRHFRALSVVFDQHEPTDAQHFFLGVRDWYGSALTDGTNGYSAQTLAWFQEPSVLLQESSAGTGTRGTTKIIADAYLYKRSPLEYLRDLDQRDVVIYTTEKLAAKTAFFSLIANDYEVLRIDGATCMRYELMTEEPAAMREFREERGIADMTGAERRYAPVPWPRPLSPEEALEKWIALGPGIWAAPEIRGYSYLSSPVPEPLWWWIWTIDFRRHTPRKLRRNDEATMAIGPDQHDANKLGSL